MPKYSTVSVYGVLSGENVNNVDVGDVLYNHKTVTGLYLPNWIHEKGMLKMIPVMMRLKKLLKNELKS
jgi:hypothetical protein